MRDLTDSFVSAKRAIRTPYRYRNESQEDDEQDTLSLLEEGAVTWNAAKLTVNVPPDQNPNESQIKNFLNQVGDIRDKITTIESVVKQIKRHQEAIHSTGNSSRNDKEHDQLKQAMDQIQKLFDTVKEGLNDIKQQSEALSCEQEAEQAAAAEDVACLDSLLHSEDYTRPADMRIMRTHVRSLQCWFFDIWIGYNECQYDYRERCRATIVRQIQITDKEVPQEKITKMLDTGKFTVFSFSEKFGDGDLEELKCRHADMTKLAESLKLCQDLFKDVALLVECQGEMLNNIEANLDDAKEYTSRVAYKILPAISRKQNNRRKVMCVVAVIVALILAIIVITIALKYS